MSDTHFMNTEARTAVARVFFGIIVAALLYVTTVPFRVEQPSNFGKKWERAELIPFHLRKGERYHPSDLLGNVLLFIPFGFALQGWRMERRGGTAVRLWPVIAGGMLMSLTIEVTQFFLRDRYMSINDWVLNVAGAAVGALAARHFYNAGLSQGLTWARKIIRRPGMIALLALLATHALWMLQPFNFTLSTNNMLRKWLQWKFSAGYLAALPHEILTLDRREYWPLVILENLFFGIIVGGQFILCWRWYWPDNQRRLTGGLVLLVFSLCCITLMQFLVIGTNPDVLPLAAVAAGMALGIIAMKNLTGQAQEISAWPLQPHPWAEATLLMPFLLLFTLLLLRPDLPDLRVLQIQEAKAALSQNALMAFFTELLNSLLPSQLSLGGSAYFRLFLKLLLITMPLAFGIAILQRHRMGAMYRQNILNMIGWCTAVGLTGQALRFFVWRSSVSLLAVVALAAGGILGAWLENWWQGFKSHLQQPAIEKNLSAAGIEPQNRQAPPNPKQ